MHIRIVSLALNDGTNDSIDELFQLGLLRYGEVFSHQWVDALVVHATSLANGGKGVGKRFTQGVLIRTTDRKSQNMYLAVTVWELNARLAPTIDPFPIRMPQNLRFSLVQQA